MIKIKTINIYFRERKMIKLILIIVILMIHQNYLNADESGCMLQGSSKKELELFNRLKPLFNKT